uniref:Mitotic checkpoint serine/threonine-protein kinase BUB1 n=1 Tax=Timema shepardi TaxID=629360 RepID=A0A7R9FWU9_TIMSH|nr:unnamed protein product [Timema shepardi]
MSEERGPGACDPNIVSCTTHRRDTRTIKLLAHTPNQTATLISRERCGTKKRVVRPCEQKSPDLTSHHHEEEVYHRLDDVRERTDKTRVHGRPERQIEFVNTSRRNTLQKCWAHLSGLWETGGGGGEYTKGNMNGTRCANVIISVREAERSSIEKQIASLSGEKKLDPPLSHPQYSNHDIPVIGSPVYCERETWSSKQERESPCRRLSRHETHVQKALKTGFPHICLGGIETNRLNQRTMAQQSETLGAQSTCPTCLILLTPLVKEIILKRDVCIRIKGRVENHFVKINLITPDRDLDLDLPIIGILVYYESSTLDHAATGAAKTTGLHIFITEIVNLGAGCLEGDLMIPTEEKNSSYSKDYKQSADHQEFLESQSKENIQPLRQGRVVSQLGTALEAQDNPIVYQELIKEQQRYEVLIRSYEGGDPLQLWVEYVSWVEQCFPQGNGRDSKYPQILEKCLTLFKDDANYKQDLRYVKLWVKYGVTEIVSTAVAVKEAGRLRNFLVNDDSVAIMVEPFLIQFQSDAPLAPFLYEALISLMKSLMKRFVKSDKLDSARSLLELGIFNETNLLNAKYVDLGYATREAIRKTKGVSEKEILLFRQDCKTCLQKLCAKLLERSPLKYKLTKAISFLDPAVAVLKSTRSERLKSTLEIVLANNWITGVAADLVDRQFNIKAIGGIEKVDITKSLIHSVRNARSRYKDSLEQKMKDKQNGEKQEGDRKRAAIELQANPQEFFQLVHSHGIGTQTSLFYRCWAYHFELTKDFKHADEVYRLGCTCNAQPKEELDTARETLQMLVGQMVLGYEVQTPVPPLMENRTTFAKLNLAGNQTTRVGTAILHKSPGKLRPLQPSNHRPNKQKISFRIIGDENAVPDIGGAKADIKHVPRKEEVGKENLLKPGPWTGGNRRHRPSNAATHTIPERTGHTRPSFQIHQDIDDQQWALPKAVETGSALKPLKLVDDFKCATAIFEPLDPKFRPMYCKNKVYAGGTEFSLEELRAIIYNKKYEEKKKQVDIATSSSNSNLEGVQLNELCMNENILSVVPFKLEKEDSNQKCTPEGSLDVFDKENRVPGFTDQSSIHNQSLTVNTREAMNAVRGLWTTSKDYWLSNDARPDLWMQTNSPATRNPRHKLFAIEQPAPAQVLNPVTFPIFSEESSACDPEHSASSNMIPESILKPSVLSHKEAMPKRRTVAANSAVLDKENVPFPIYCDDEDDDNDDDNDDDDDELEFGKDQHLQQPKTLGELPFVPSPGMTAEEELALMGTEDKENQSRGKALMEPPKRRLAGILQPATDIPLNQQPEESVAMVFSEVSNETCNTQAFSFPLKSSTPFTTDLNKSFPVDTSMICPDNGVINKCGVDNRTISLVLHPAIPSRPEEKSGPLQPSTGSDNLSVIMENSREFYKSSSSSGSSAVSSTRRTTLLNSQYPGTISLDTVQETSSCSEMSHMPTRRKQRQVENVVSHTSIKDTDIQVKRKVLENPLATNQEEELMKGVGNLVMDPSQIDPFDEVLKERLLTRVGFPQSRNQSFFILEATLPRLKISSNITLGNECYTLDSILGEGAYAKVYKASNFNNKKEVALKIQSSSCAWEFYICQEIRRRLGECPQALSFMMIESAYVFTNYSVLVTEVAPYGNLLSVLNTYRTKTGRCFNHMLAMFLTVEILRIQEQLMKCHIIHGDIKPDNFLVRALPNLEDNCPFLELIDFGRSIDMDLFLPGTQFTRVVTTEGFQCIEMQTKRPWTYQTDLYGLAGTAHCLLFGDYMKVRRRPCGKWNIETTIPRYFCRPMWELFFSTLLNIESCEQLPDLSKLRELFQEVLLQDVSNLKKDLNTLRSIVTDSKH